MKFSSKLLLSLIPFFWFFTGLSQALSPLQSFYALVAGEGTTGSEDGPFTSALFHTPMGLALSPDGTKLYVADRDNNCVRMVALENKNEVSTLTGSGKPGNLDGTLATSTFKKPTGLLVLPDGRIIVNDDGNSLLRVIDLEKQAVQTLAGNGTPGTTDGDSLKASLGGIWNLVYYPADGGVYFSQPQFGTLRRLDLATGAVSTLLNGFQPVPHPQALCVLKDILYVSDNALTQVYQFQPKKPVATTNNPLDNFSFAAAAAGKQILSMAGCGTTLYALQADPLNPLIRLVPVTGPVSYVSLWGRASSHFRALDQLDYSLAPGFVADPRSDRQFFFTRPTQNIVLSFRDLYLSELIDAQSFNSRRINDFEYPTSKPAHTFRILLLGDSHIYHTFDADAQRRGWVDYYNKMEIISERLQLMLNTQAALDDIPTRFEVLSQWHVIHEHQLLWPYKEVPPIARAYDVDLVLMMVNPQTKVINFSAVKTNGGYFLEPVHWKTPADQVRKLFNLCKSKGLAKGKFESTFSFSDLDKLEADPDVERSLTLLKADPLSLLAEKLGNMKNSGGTTIGLDLFLLPLGRFEPGKTWSDSWKKISANLHVPLLSLVDEFNAFRESYYPFSEIGSFDHFSADGFELIAYLMAHKLIHESLIPFQNPLK